MASRDWQLAVEMDSDYGQGCEKYVKYQSKQLFVWHSISEDPRFSLKSLVFQQFCLQDAEVLAKTFENQAPSLQSWAHLMLWLKTIASEKRGLSSQEKLEVAVRHGTCDMRHMSCHHWPCRSCWLVPNVGLPGLMVLLRSMLFLGGVLVVQLVELFKLDLFYFFWQRRICLFLPHVLIDGTWCISLVCWDRQERKMTGIKAAEEAVQFYGTVNQKSGEVEAEPFVIGI